ncbi:MAG TPA: DoxX family membrane protein [Chitinophaga sp.]
MNLLQRIESWGDRHHPKWLDFVRIGLGMFLFYMGVIFIQNRDALTALIDESPFLTAVSFWVAHYIVFAHLAGGLLITLGLLTRVAVIANIPVLLGAVLFVHSPTGLFEVYTQLGLSILVLFLLIFFLIEGSGPVSIDEYMRKHPN